LVEHYCSRRTELARAPVWRCCRKL